MKLLYLHLPQLSANKYLTTDNNGQRTAHNAQLRTIDDSRGQQVVALLVENLQYQWQVQELADAVLMSSRQLERCFKASLKCRPLYYSF